MSMTYYYSKMGVNSYRIKSPAVTKGGRTLATRKITTKIRGYFTERLLTTLEGGTPKKLPWKSRLFDSTSLFGNHLGLKSLGKKS